MDIEERPPWSGKKLAALGKALVAGTPVPANCPTYDQVMEWNSDLCATVAAIVATEDWESCNSDEFDIAARPKTLDTLLQKLERGAPSMTLNQVQDLAGVRIDVDCSLDEQTALADEIVAHFGSDRSSVKDIREDPHSGYRGVHVWLRLPAGRVEIQIRTRAQSAWANTYERLGDLAGRGIRYGEPHPDEAVNQLVEYMQGLSERLARWETLHRDHLRLQGRLDTLVNSPGADPEDERLVELRTEIDRMTEGSATTMREYLEDLARFKRILDHDRETEEG